MATTEKELARFVNDPRYRNKVLAKIHKQDDAGYQKRINAAQVEINRLNVNRTQEIARLTDLRWQKYANGGLMVNQTEGKIKVNGTDFLFSSIRGAEMNALYSCRVESTTTGSSKRRGSLGGAVVGGLVGGATGAVVGGVGMGKTKIKTNTVSNEIPTCTHLGVRVNLDGFVSEIVILSRQIDVASREFNNYQAVAQQMVTMLGMLAKTPVPARYILPENEQSVLEINKQISLKQSELQKIVAAAPTYEIPQMYRLPECSALTDAEYLSYLAKADAERSEQQAQGQVIAQGKERAETGRKKAVSVMKTLLNIAYYVLFWNASLGMLLLCLVPFNTEGGLLSGLIFLFSALIANPHIINLVQKLVKKIPRWAYVIIVAGLLPIGFIVGFMVYPQYPG